MIILPPIALSILIIAWMVEKIEKSKIGSAYFKHMVVFIITPILVGGIVVWLFDGNLDWLGD
jgi:drug/metabolite transporter superfamily protein YnfA